jgi:hypothetical protein
METMKGFHWQVLVLAIATLVVADGASAADTPTRCVTKQDDFDRSGPPTASSSARGTSPCIINR